MKERKKALEEIAQSLSIGLMGKEAYLKRKDNVFFRCYGSACVQRDVVYYGSRRYGLNFELMNMNQSYFTGSKNHALALLEALGGKAYPSEFVCVVEPMDLWIWEGPDRAEQVKNSLSGDVKPLDFELVKSILFDDEENYE